MGLEFNLTIGVQARANPPHCHALLDRAKSSTPDANLYSKTNSIANCNLHPYSHSNACSNTSSNPCPNSHTNSYASFNSYAYINTNSYAYINTKACPCTEANTDSLPNAKTNAYPFTLPNTNTKTVVNTKTTYLPYACTLPYAKSNASSSFKMPRHFYKSMAHL